MLFVTRNLLLQNKDTENGIFLYRMCRVVGKMYYFCFKGEVGEGIFVYTMRLEKGWLVLLVLLAGCVLPSSLWGAKSKTTDQRIEHVAMLSREVYWPSLRRQPKFFVEYVGTPSDFSDTFVRYFKRHRIRGKAVQVTLTTNWENRNKQLYPNLIFVSASASAYVPRICKFFENYPVLIVSEQPYYGSGWMVSLIPQNLDAEGYAHDWAYNLDISNIKLFAGLNVSSRLISNKYKATEQEGVTVTKKKTDGDEASAATPIDYIAQWEARGQLIASQATTIELLQDTIVQQRSTIDSLKTYNILFASRFSLWNVARKDVLWGTWNATNTKMRNPSVRRVRINTAPWESEAMGFVIFILLGMVSLISVVSFSSGGFLGANKLPVVADHAAVFSATVGGMAVARNEQKQKTVMTDSFLGNVSHELRTPLNAIVGLSQYVASTQNVDAEVRESLEIINNNAHGLMQMMNNLLTLAMLQRNELTVKWERINLAVFLSELYWRMFAYVESLKRENEVVLQPIQRGEDVFISCDLEKLRSVFELLLTYCIPTSGRRILSFGGVQHTDSKYILYVYAAVGEESKSLSSSDFTFAETMRYRKDELSSEIRLDTVEGLLGVMGTNLYHEICGLEQKYYFCMSEL